MVVRIGLTDAIHMLEINKQPLIIAITGLYFHTARIRMHLFSLGVLDTKQFSRSWTSTSTPPWMDLLTGRVVSSQMVKSHTSIWEATPSTAELELSMNTATDKQSESQSFLQP